MEAFTVSAAARLCGVDRRTLQRAIQAGRLPLDAQHCLSRETLIAAGYLDATPHYTPHYTPQGASHVTSQGMPQDTLREEPRLTSQETPHQTPQGTPQELLQATALLALLERLTSAISDLHAEVRALRSDLRRLPQEAPRGTPREAPQDTPRQAPQPSPQILGLYDPRAAAARIRDLRQQGLSYTMIALELTREGIPTRYGKPWEHSRGAFGMRVIFPDW